VSGSFYDDPQVFEAYEGHRRSGVSSPGYVMEEPALWQELGSVAGQRVADLGCGDAAIGAALLDAGCASYYGVDASAAMVQAARAALNSQPARIEQARIESFAFPPGSFDLVISRLALHYVDDIAPVLRACGACLTPGGRLILTVVHPVITSHHEPEDPGRQRTSWLVDNYFVPGPRRRPWLGRTVTWQHRTIEDYVSALTGAGFSLTALRECPPRRSLFGHHDAEFARRLRTPLFLLLAATSGRRQSVLK
jgi:SAM-dependent methyltransferase